MIVSPVLWRDRTRYHNSFQASDRSMGDDRPRRPRPARTRRPSISRPVLHWDVSLHQPIPLSTHGILYLTDTEAVASSIRFDESASMAVCYLRKNLREGGSHEMPRRRAAPVVAIAVRQPARGRAYDGAPRSDLRPQRRSAGRESGRRLEHTICAEREPGRSLRPTKALGPPGGPRVRDQRATGRSAEASPRASGAVDPTGARK